MVDTMTFDVYFGTDNPSTQKIAEEINDTTVYHSPNFNNYYWKLLVKEDKGGIAIGQVWGFKNRPILW